MLFRPASSCCLPSILVQALITSHTPALSSDPLSCLQLFLSPVIFILSTQNSLPEASFPPHTSCSGSQLHPGQALVFCSKAPLTAQTIYLSYSWTSLWPSNVLTVSVQCYNIWLIQSTLSNLQLIIWMLCLQDAKHLDWLKEFTTLMEVGFSKEWNWPDVLALHWHIIVPNIYLNSPSAQPFLHLEQDPSPQCHVFPFFQIMVKMPCHEVLLG